MDLVAAIAKFYWWLPSSFPAITKSLIIWTLLPQLLKNNKNKTENPSSPYPRALYLFTAFLLN
jgi:hypothetical protein